MRGLAPGLVRRRGLRCGELERRHGAELRLLRAWERVLLRLSDVEASGVWRVEPGEAPPRQALAPRSRTRASAARPRPDSAPA